MTTIGIIGAGDVGSQIARAAIRAGYHVVIANSRGPAPLSRLAHELYATAASLGGSFSAEYGIGRIKRDLVERYADPVRFGLMRKAALRSRL